MPLNELSTRAVALAKRPEQACTRAFLCHHWLCVCWDLCSTLGLCRAPMLRYVGPILCLPWPTLDLCVGHFHKHCKHVMPAASSVEHVLLWDGRWATEANSVLRQFSQDLPDATANFTSVNAAACAAQLDGLARAGHPNVTADIGSSCIYGLLASSDLRHR